MEETIKFKEVYVSIVTIPKLDELEPGGEDFTRFKSTYVEHKEFLNDRQAIQSYYDNAGRSIAFNKIFQISLGFVVNDSIRVKVLTGDEKNIINEFHETLKENFSEAKLYGYNTEFIYDVIKFRGRVNRIHSSLEAAQFKDIGNKPWNRKQSISLMDEVVSSNRSKLSLINALYGAELDYSGILSTEDISVWYKSGKFDEIHESGAKSIKGLVNLKRFLETEEELNDLSYSVKNAETQEEKEINVLEHLLASGELTSKVLDTIVKFAEDEKLDKESVYILVTAALSKTKDYQNVDNEIKEEVREVLGLKTLQELKEEKKAEEHKRLSEKYSKIQAVVNKGNLGAKEAKYLISQYQDSTREEKQEVAELTERFLKENGKLNQKRAAEALKLLKTELKCIN